MKYLSRLVLVVVTALGCEGDGCDGGGFIDARESDGTPPGGTLSVMWSLVTTTGQPLTCDQVGGLSVNLLLRDPNVQGSQVEVLGCSSGSGTTPPVTPGTYDVRFELAGADGVIATSPTQPGLVVRSGQNTPLAPIAFAVNAVGGLELAIAANRPGGNCGSIATNGAGITATTITLTDARGLCEPVTFTITAGATRPAGTYSITSCTSPMAGPCIESDQRLIATGVPSDRYTLRVRGKIGAADCYVNDETLQVPPLGRTLTRTLNLSRQTIPGC